MNKLLFVDNKGVCIISVLLFDTVYYKGHLLKVSCFESTLVGIL